MFQNQVPQTERIEYIDALRGFTMILVIYYHVQVISYGYNDFDSFNNVFIKFRMPLFFFISGWVLNNNKLTTALQIGEFIKKKFRVQIISTFIFLFLYLYINQIPLNNAIFDGSKHGYWFTYTLFIYFCFYCTSKLLSFFLHHENIFILAICIFVLIIYFYTQYDIFYSDSKPSYDKLYSLLSVSKWNYYLFFVMGIMVKKYYKQFISLTNNSYFMTFSIVTFLLLILLNSTHFSAQRFLLEGPLGILIIFTYFRKNETSFTHEHFIGRSFQYIGKRTLDIYLLHYFFVPKDLAILGHYFSIHNNPSIELFISMGISLMVICVCLITSQIIRTSDFLAFLLFGAKRKIK